MDTKQNKTKQAAESKAIRLNLDEVLAEMLPLTEQELERLYIDTDVSEETDTIGRFSIMNTFISLFGPKALNDLLNNDHTGDDLMHRLFDDKQMCELRGAESLLFWLVCKRSGLRGRNMILFGRTGEFNQRGILCKTDGCYDYNGRKRTKISYDEARACARETLAVINEICAFIDGSIRAGVTFNDAWYKSLSDKITEVCSKQLHSPLWYGANKNYQLRPYLLKYFHVLYPDIIAGFYSKKHVKIALALLGGAYSDDISVIENNGRISQKMYRLLPGKPDGVRFAKALYPKVYDISDRTN